MQPSGETGVLGMFANMGFAPKAVLQGCGVLAKWHVGVLAAQRLWVMCAGPLLSHHCPGCDAFWSAVQQGACRAARCLPCSLLPSGLHACFSVHGCAAMASSFL